MKRIASAIAVVLIAGAAAADPAEGVWQTVPDDNGNFGHVEMTTCGAALCGTLVRAYDASGKEIASPNVGRRIVWDMAPRGGGAYGGGKVYSPDRDKTYNGRLTLTDRGLGVEGCVLGICRDGGTWRRVD
ncbi:MAG: DUF2147 domain-containing protein [Thermoleophilia bacterium]|jgi:uncharacterized protein (DUF2147 family)|nr:DUF2147 domain-containing protein [Thermoleophilia bacterium]